MKFRILVPAVLLLVFSVSCTKDFEDMNKDDGKISEITPQELPYLFARALSVGSPFSYQTYQNLYADLYAQYFATTATAFQTDRYFIRQDWNTNNWRNQYTGVPPQLKAIFDHTDPNSNEYALASIWWVYCFHHLTDYFGPIPYFEVGEVKDGILPYDAQEAIYNDFFDRLKTAVQHLKENTPGSLFGSSDLIYGGDTDKWIRFANSLRLRLALRISYVNPQKARQEAKEAVAAGVMESNQDNARMRKSLAGNDYNQLAHIAVWNEFSMSSGIFSYLKGYNDPRLGVYFQPAKASGEFASLRNGQPNVDLNQDQNQPRNLSQIGTSWVSPTPTSWTEHPERPQDIMRCAEVAFLRAEGALNGWNMGGSAEMWYNQGITLSLEEHGVPPAEIEGYLQSEGVPAAPEDFNNSEPVSDIPVRWSPDMETQRAQIGTQKWLAIYPDGFEAWAEIRRTGYPILYPVVQSDNPDLPAGTPIKRIPYPEIERQTNAEALEGGRALLGGPDNAATRLWWDVR